MSSQGADSITINKTDETSTSTVMHYAIPRVILERLKIFPCPQCEKVFVEENKMETHIKWHERNKYLETPGVMKHFKSAYVSLRPVVIYRCNICTRAFLHHSKLYTHQLREHSKGKDKSKFESNNEKRHACAECGARFVAAATLAAHAAVHAPPPHACHCGVRYRRREDLAAHTRLVHPARTPERDCAPRETSENLSRPRPQLRANLVYAKSEPRKTSKENEENVAVALHNGYYTCVPCGESFTNMAAARAHRCPLARRRRPPACRKKPSEPKPASFICDICNKNFTCKGYLYNHMRVHTKEKPYPCPDCPKRFTQSGALKLHRLRHRNEKNFECGHCAKKFYNKSSMQLHERVHTKERPFECGDCGKRFGDPSAFARHRRTHTGETPYRCKLCPAAYGDASALTAHARRRHERATVPCPACGKRLASQNNVNQHLRRIHGRGPQKSFQCDHCGKKFTAKMYLALHIKNMHLNPEKNKRFQCRQCLNLFRTTRMLQVHVQRVHEVKEFKYQCDYCGKKLNTTKKNLIKHIRDVHLSSKCETCGKTFSSPSKIKLHQCLKCYLCGKYMKSSLTLRDHIWHRHQRLGKHKCKSCPKRFTVYQHLLKHVALKHKQTGTYICDYCGEKYQNKDVLKTHILRSHSLLLYCNICLKPFAVESEFKRHKENCTITKYPCNFCEVTCPNSIMLLKHLRKWHQPKRVPCEFCDSTFKIRYYLNSHIKEYHLKNNKENIK